MAFQTGTSTDFIDLLSDLIDFADANGWDVERETQEAASAVVAGGGTGYTVGDDITLVGGTGDIAAVFNVDAETGGVVTAVSVVTAGRYTAVPANPVATTGHTGDCTLTVTWQRGTSNANEVILKGEGSGLDEIFVGIRTFKSGTSAYNWELAGMTGYAAGLTYASQPGISPGRYDDPAPAARPGCYVPLNNTAITYWMNVTGRRIICVFKIGSTYVNMYLGWLDQYGTSVEYPYPLLVMGCQSEYATVYSDSKIYYSGMCDPIADNDTGKGPGYVRDPGGTWVQVLNSYNSFSTRAAAGACVVFPCAQTTITSVLTQDKYFQQLLKVTKFVPGSGTPGTQTVEVLQEPGAVSTMFPCVIIMVTPTAQVLGELSDVRWVSAVADVANIVVEDQLDDGVDTWKVFQNCNRTNNWAKFAVREA